ncbi:hypothetical protein HAX54_001871, partial [Datura stramonium]|nr:hypothetical protein [Datura stramonium]
DLIVIARRPYIHKNIGNRLKQKQNKFLEGKDIFNGSVILPPWSAHLSSKIAATSQ